jgi:hypothetical protein
LSIIYLSLGGRDLKSKDAVECRGFVAAAYDIILSKTGTKLSARQRFYKKLFQGG